MAVKVLIMQSRVCNAMHAVSIYVAASLSECVHSNLARPNPPPAAWLWRVL
jgi:hypothetical protein